MYTDEVVEARIIELISDLTRDWDVELEEGMSADTMLIGDIGFASIDFVQLVVAVEAAYKAKLGFHDLLMQNGKYVDDLNVRQITRFVTDRLNRGTPSAASVPAAAVPGGASLVASIPESERVTAEMLARFQSSFLSRPLRDDGSAKNERAIFVLSPPRSGSTLLRILMAGNSKLFAPPELHLLPYNTMGERRRALAGEYTEHLLDGTVRALMQLHGWEPDQARAFVEQCEQEEMSTQAFYRVLQEPLKGERLLVDKTPSYIFQLETLKRIERDFENPVYIHLLRHPLGMIRSYEESQLQRLLPQGAQESGLGSRGLAEMTWLTAQQNTLAIAEHVPQERWLQIRYEDVVAQPEVWLRKLCSFVGIPFEEAMVNPYEDMDQRMTDGVDNASKMSGDLKFHLHSAINPASAVRWKEFYSEDVLGTPTREMASALGY